jgi:hypothetical protein
MPLRLPTEENRTSIVGATGSGKTIAETWHLSMRAIDQRPYAVFNWKGDKSIDGIPHARHIGLDEIPTKPGVYIYHPRPTADDDEVESIFWEIWEREKIGVVIDEGYMVPKNSAAFRALLTQGRSKEIPMIVLSQRPVHMDRFVFSESEFFQVFRLQHEDDAKTVQKFIPRSIGRRLAKHHSYYYDAAEDKLVTLKPVPPIEEQYKIFDRKLRLTRRTT